MNELKKISDKRQSSKSLKVGSVVIAVAIAAGLLPFIKQSADQLGEKRDTEKKEILKRSEKFILSCLDKAADGNFHIAKKSLEKLNPGELNTDLRAKWFTTMTKILQMEADVYKDRRQFLIMQALTYAQRGILAGTKQSVIDNLNQMKARLYLMNQQWEPAAKILQDLQSRTKSPKERWKHRLTIAHCQNQLGNYQKALHLLDSVIDETDEETTWATALRRKADILFKISQVEHNISEVPFDPQNSLLTLTVDSTLDSMSTLLEAEAYYRELVENIPSNIHPDKMKALERLLEIYVNRKQSIEAYQFANMLKRAAGDRPYSAPVFKHMARLEIEKNNLKRAENYLLRLIKSHPESEHTEPALMDYYKLLKKRKEWARAFNLGHTITQSNVSDDSKIEIIEDLILGEPLISNNDLTLEGVQPKVIQILNSVNTNDHELQSIIQFAKASNRFNLGKYYEADKHFSEYLQTPGFNRFKEQAHFYYLLSAVNADLPPVVQALRARLYLNNTFNAKRSQQVMIYLMSAYYDMDLWDKSIEAAMKVFVSEIVRMGEENEDYQASDEWLKAVARIGQSYERLGQNTKAQSVFKTWAKEFRKSPYAASIYADWAQIASDKGNHREALRRLNIIMPYIKKPNDFMLLISMSCIQKLKVNDKDAWKDAAALIKQLPKKKDKLGEEKIAGLLKEIHMAMLENSIQFNPEKAEESFNLALEKYKSDPWPYNLIIKWLQNNKDSENYRSVSNFLQKAAAGPLTALPEGKLRKAIKDQVDLLVAMENENVF